MSEYQCPSCDSSFDTQQGRGIHYVSVHGERLPNRICDRCRKSFYCDYAKKYGSQDCLLQSDSYAGENNANYKGGKETTECSICRSEFEFYPSEKPGIYWSKCVENEQWQTPPGLSGPDHPRCNGGKIERTCDHCGSKVRRRRSAFSDTVTLGGRECQRKWLSDSFTGEGHPNGKGGGSELYGKGWRRAKLTTLARDNYTSVVCGKTKDDIGRNPDVHHLVSVRSFADADGADKTDAHVPRNPVSLCVACHRRADFGRPAKAALKGLIDAAR